MKYILLLTYVLIVSFFNPATAQVDNYFNELPKQIIWENPKSITVYTPKSDKYLILRKAFQYWDDKLGSTVNFIYLQKPGHANIYCTFVDASRGSIVGVTYNTFNKNLRKHMTDAKVYVAMKDTSGAPFNDDMLFSIALHEIGHAIGIHGHSSNINDIMYPYATGTLFGKGAVSARDINTAKMLYGVKFH